MQVEYEPFEPPSSSHDDAGRDELLPGRERRAVPWWVVAIIATVAIVIGIVLTTRNRDHQDTSPPVKSAALIGNVWLFGGDAKHGSFYIGRNGELVADDQCRLVTAKASVEGNRIRTSDFVVRPKSCDPTLGNVPLRTGTAVLRGPTTFTIDRQRLTIAGSGNVRVRLSLAPAAVPAPSADIPTLTATDWVAAGGRVLRIEPDGRMTGTYCDGHAVIDGARVSFAGCAGLTTTAQPWTVRGTRLDLDGASFRYRPVRGVRYDRAALSGHAWKLEAVGGSAAIGDIRLRVGPQLAVIGDGCQPHADEALVQDGRLLGTGTFAPSPCGGAIGAQAAAIDDFFDGGTTWFVRDGKLFVYTDRAFGQSYALVYGVAASSPSDLIGPIWRDGAVTVVFTSDTVKIAGSCTSGRYRLTIAATSLRIGTLIPNESMCAGGPGLPGRAAPVEPIVRQLQGTLSWAVVGDTLQLTPPGGRALTFTKVSPGIPDTGLPGTATGTWVLTAITHGVGAHAMKRRPSLAAQFTFAPGQATASGQWHSDELYVGHDSLLFNNSWINELISGFDQPELSGTDSAFVFRRVLVGRVGYVVRGDTLVVTKPNVGSLTFRLP